MGKKTLHSIAVFFWKLLLEAFKIPGEQAVPVLLKTYCNLLPKLSA